MTQQKSHEGESQWQLIWHEFAKRRLAVLSAGVIFFLIQTAIWAPFLANDRPYHYVGTNRWAYQNSLLSCRGALKQLIEALQKSPQSVPPVYLRDTLLLHLPRMNQSLAAQDAQRLTVWTNELLAALKLTEPQAAIQQFTELRRSLQADFADNKVQLVPRTRWPVFASLTWLDVYFMTWSLLTVTFPAWRYGVRRLPSKSVRHTVGWSVWLGVPLVASLAWFLAVPSFNDASPYRKGQFAAVATDSSPVSYETVVWPPIPYGFKLGESEDKHLRPPWWPGTKTAVGSPKEPPSSPWDKPHWLGTDQNGRDVLARLIWGGRVSLSVGIVSVSIYVALGILIGALAGFFRGYADLLISRFIEIVICFPTFFLILTIVALQGPSIWNIMIVIGLTGWTGVARLIRAEFLRLVDQEFVLAGRALGYSPARLIFRHILPNAMAPVLVSATFGIAGAILTESALSYLGLGITIPIPSWGSLLLDGNKSEGVAPWLIILPGLTIFITITCYNLVGEALRDASDPRLRGSR